MPMSYDELCEAYDAVIASRDYWNARARYKQDKLDFLTADLTRLRAERDASREKIEELELANDQWVDAYNRLRDLRSPQEQLQEQIKRLLAKVNKQARKIEELETETHEWGVAYSWLEEYLQAKLDKQVQKNKELEQALDTWRGIAGDNSDYAFSQQEKARKLEQKLVVAEEARKGRESLLDDYRTLVVKRQRQISDLQKRVALLESRGRFDEIDDLVAALIECKYLLVSAGLTNRWKNIYIEHDLGRWL